MTGKSQRQEHGWPHGILSQDTREAEEEECDVYGPGSPA